MSSLRARGLPLMLVFLAACPTRTRRVGVVAGPPEPPAVTVRPLEAADLARDPRRSLVLGAGGPGRARPVRLVGRPHWLAVAAPLADDEQSAGWDSFWLIARPRRLVPIKPPTRQPSQGQKSGPGAVPDPSRSAADGGPAGPPPPPPEPPTGPALAGDEWKRALWIADLSATRAVGLSPLDVDFSAVSRGAQVHPPGAASLAVAALAALTGASLDSSAVVIAELEPDASLGPVDDPVRQVQDALRRGARRLVLPYGGASITPAGSDAPVDLIRLSREAGAEAWMAPDLGRAYRSLTGAPLPEPEPAAVRDLALARDERGALDTGYHRALERIADTWPHLLEQQNRARMAPPLAALVAAAESGARRAERWRAAGDRAAAYVRLTEAAALADAAARLDQILRLVADGELDRARAEVDAARAPPEAARMVPPGDDPPTTIGEHLRASGVFALAATSWAWSEEAAARGKRARAALASLAGADRARLADPATARKVAEAVAPLLIASARARLEADLALDRGALDPGGGPGFTADADHLRQLAAADASAAAAAVADLGALAGGATGADARSARRASDEEAAPDDAPEAVAARRILALVGDDGDLARGSGRAVVAAERSPLLALAVARRAFEGAGAALARARRLRPELDPWTGQVSVVGRPGRLRLALSLAAGAARQQATAARVAIGSIPVGARLAFEAAQDLSRGDRLERVKAVELYQAASAECRLAILLALSEKAAARTSGAGSATARAGCPPSPSARSACR
ncbi:MAG TPA: hypothetical protein VKB80_05445 [Kofleriaceae bacterium]|nr:hypothetical protein [Kofleriaceae bacterium]